MRALGQRSFGGPEVLEEIVLPIPEVTGADLRVRLHATAVNPVDLKARTNWNGFGELQGAAPWVTGWDGAGVVDAVGPTADGRFKIGDEVFFAGSVARRGCQSEYAVVDSRIVGRKPKTLTFAEAAALPLTSLTVWEGVLDHAGLGLDAAPGTPPVVLIVGGAGGVGSIAVQILKRVAGATVIATASRPESGAFCTKLGADHVVDHSKDLRTEVRALGIQHVSHVLHCASPDANFSQVADLLAPGGSIVCILPFSAPVDTSALFAKSGKLVFELMFTRPMFGVELARQGQILDKVAALVDAGTLRTTLVDTFPWTVEGLRAAHDRLEGGRGVGKAVLALPMQ